MDPRSETDIPTRARDNQRNRFGQGLAFPVEASIYPALTPGPDKDRLSERVLGMLPMRFSLIDHQAPPW